jgi:hypothetical protein
MKCFSDDGAQKSNTMNLYDPLPFPRTQPLTLAPLTLFDDDGQFWQINLNDHPYIIHSRDLLQS